MEKIKGKDILFVLTATVLMAVCDVLFYTFSDGKPLKGFLILGANYIMALAMWVVLRLSQMIRLRTILQSIFLLVIAAYSCLLAFCRYRFGAPMDKDMIALVTGTNNAEAQEFFDVYLTPATFIILSIALILILGVSIALTHRDFKPSRKLLKGLAIWTLAAFSGVGYSFYTLPGRIEGILRTEQKNLNNYLHHPVLEETKTSHPGIVMIIIGESFIKSHSSLYGYDKLTNPRLQQEVDSGNLIVFKHVTAPDTHTSEAFKYFMTQQSHQTKNKEWYEYLTLTEVFNCAKYHSVWFSNQAQTGWYDNISATFAKMCEKVVYTTNSNEGELGAKPDGILLNEVQKYMAQLKPNSRHVIFVHLMGQHTDFQKRYPPEFEHFKQEQYLSRLLSQQKNYATYDNATLYNDFVVDSLFSIMKGHEAVGVYFSDHGLDFYVSADDYCSHANNNDSISVKAGLQIPLMIYSTTSYQTTHATTMKELEQQANLPYNTENLPYLIYDLIGYQPKDNQEM